MLPFLLLGMKSTHTGRACLLLGLSRPLAQHSSKHGTHGDHHRKCHAHQGSHLRRDEVEGDDTAEGLREGAKTLADGHLEGTLEVLNVT